MTNNFRHFTWFALIFILYLTACGGGSNEAVEDTTDTTSSTADEAADSESVTDPGIGATGSNVSNGRFGSSHHRYFARGCQ